MLTQEKLKSVLKYDKETGVFSWLITRPNIPKIKIGTPAGYLNPNGYIYIRISGKYYKAHRLAFLYETGKMPINDVDHIDGIKNNNAFLNLRNATRIENSRNRSFQSNNTTGFKGVTFCKYHKKYKAYCSINGVKKSLGYFSTPEEASEAYEKYASSNFGEFYKEISKKELTLF